MNETNTPGGTNAQPPAAQIPQIVVNVPDPHKGSWKLRILMILLLFSIMFNFQYMAQKEAYFGGSSAIQERFHSGTSTSPQKIARIVVSGTIMPPFTSTTLEKIEKAQDDESVKGVLLVVDSPGGLVTDSHQIYHQLQKLAESKPIYVAMKDMAASGGYYIAMGGGANSKIYAEPTTWTGSIGVIIPHYDASELAKNVGVTSDSLKTGPLKDSLSPFRPMSEQDIQVWDAIIDDAFVRFKTVIAENRDTLDMAKVDALATGQIYTATQAKENGLVDVIGFEEEALAALQTELGLEEARIVTYEGPPSLLDALMGTAQANSPSQQWQAWMEQTVPKAMYYCSWLPILPGTR